jgi:pimeloyl-ACP methyl ester carboxylesterase
MKNPVVLGLALLLAACASVAPPLPAEVPPQAAACPEGTPAGARCLRGQDSARSHYLIVVPQGWDGKVLVLHAHGGPALGEPKAERADEDIKRWAITVKAGYAWAASVFRQGGVAVTSAAEDTERLRRIFVAHVAKPQRTLLHGQSWGASVAAKAAELAAARGERPYDGVLLTSGVLAGGTRSYDFRLDLRVVYQYFCNNHPRPDEPSYPLWMGLPADSKLTRAELAKRVDDCLGTAKPVAQRTPEQAAKLKTIADVIRIPQTSVLAHLNWATWHFQDIALNRAQGKPVFDNHRVRYAGSPDDAALNAGVLRYRADPQAVAAFARDADLSGRIDVPVLTVHGIRDATAFVELQSAFRETMQRGGSAERLVQTYSDDADHSYLADPVYPALFAELLDWVERGRKPTPQSVAARCVQMQATFGPGCRILPDYVPPPLAARVPPR